MAKILFVEDDEIVRYALCKYLRRAGHEIIEAQDGAVALKLAADERFDIVITDIIMPTVEGVELIMRLNQSHPQLPIIAISAGGRVGRGEYLSVAADLGASATMAKPVDEEELLRLIGTLTAG
ncbi:MAG: response regulator [Gammaproteobacteria bacterium]|nr:response regulator [Gammaproteobacteria bacterium]